MKNKCPSNKPYLCEVGACSKDSSECPTVNGCPFANPVKCEKAGTCAANEDECDLIYEKTKLPNGCNLLTPFKCDDGSCSVSNSECLAVNTCPSETPIKCINNICVKDAESCKSISLICKSDEF